MYTKIELENYNVHLYETKKFKTTTISVNFREQIKKEDITIRRFLFQMLCTNSYKYNTSRLLEIELENLYSMNLSHSTTKFGNMINSYIDMRFLSNKYSDKYLLDNAINLLHELVFNPNVIDNKFDSKTFNIIRNKLAVAIMSQKDDAAKYAVNRSFELMDSDDPISFNLWGNMDDLKDITEEDLYNYYKHVMSTNKIDIFVIGNFNKEEVINKFKSEFVITGKHDIDINPFINYNEAPEIKGFMEPFLLEQSKLSVICKVLNITTFERRYVLPIYASILANSSSSRLFTKIREKESLAYTVNASTNAPNSIFTIYAGIDAQNYEKVLQMINKELILKDITDDEMEYSKNEILSSVETLLDSPGSIINYYFGIEALKSDALEDKINNYKKVTKEDLYEFSKKIKMACVYLLRGVQNEK